MLSDKGLIPSTRALASKQVGEELEQKKRKSPVKRTSLGLRDLLFDEIDAFRAGEGDPERANAITNLAKSVMSAARLEIEYGRAKKDERFSVKEVPLGSNDEPPKIVGPEIQDKDGKS